MSAKQLRAELKALRESHPDHQPVSRMRKADVSGLIARLKTATERTPAMASVKVASKPMKEKKEKKMLDADSGTGSESEREEAREKKQKKPETKAEPKAKKETKAEPKAESKAEPKVDKMKAVRDAKKKKAL